MEQIVAIAWTPSLIQTCSFYRLSMSNSTASETHPLGQSCFCLVHVGIRAESEALGSCRRDS